MRCVSFSWAGFMGAGSNNTLKHEQIMAIPLGALITDELARGTPLGQRIVAIEHKLSAANHNQIIVFMLDTMARGDTKWQPYYDVLPADFSNFPIFWEKHELAWLQGSGEGTWRRMCSPSCSVPAARGEISRAHRG